MATYPVNLPLQLQQEAAQWATNQGIALAAQSSWSFTNLIRALDRLLQETKSEDWPGQTSWLNQWLR